MLTLATPVHVTLRAITNTSRYTLWAILCTLDLWRR